MLLTVLPLGFAFSVILWSAFPILAPGPNNTKIYYISSIGRGKQYGREQEHGRLNYRGRLHAISTSFTTVKKILIILDIVVII
jgi:hypothetical protein